MKYQLATDIATSSTITARPTASVCASIALMP
jgi:hypothetical protein